jgi:putative flippase GtrA
MAGAVNTVIGFAIFNWLLGMGAFSANAISTGIATCSSFVMNRYITYRHRPRTALRRELPLFVALNLVGLGLQQGVMALGKVTFDLQNADRLEFNLIRVFGVAIGTVFLLMTYRTFVFKVAPATVAAEQAVLDLAALDLAALDIAEFGIPALGVATFVDVDGPAMAEAPVSAVPVSPAPVSAVPARGLDAQFATIEAELATELLDAEFADQLTRAGLLANDATGGKAVRSAL